MHSSGIACMHMQNALALAQNSYAALICVTCEYNMSSSVIQDFTPGTQVQLLTIAKFVSVGDSASIEQTPSPKRVVGQ